MAHASPVQHLALVILAAIAAALYLRAWHMGRSSSVELWCWAAGVVALMTSVTPWMEAIAQRSFTGHMTQHMLMVSVAAPLVVIARPLAAIMPFGSMPPKLRRLMHSFSRTWNSSAALIAPVLFVVALFATHLTGISDAALHQQWLHDVAHLTYFTAASALWALMFPRGPRRGPERLAAAFAVIAGTAFLGAVLLTADRPLIDTYADLKGSSQAIDDQRVAALIMWGTGMTMTAPLLVMAVWRWATLEQSSGERREAPESSRSTTEPPPRPY